MAGTYNIAVEQGTTWRLRLVYKNESGTPIDLTGCTARMQVRRKVKAPDPLVTLTTENGGITLGGAAGTIDLFLSDTATSALAFAQGVYDLEIETAGGETSRVVQGAFVVSPEVTR